jgi:glycosyltransferase involved in cell wall biosynthesis
MNQTNPRISVCLATYNGGKYIKQQLDTILSQLGPLDEVIISDDGSKDQTITIVNAFNDDRISIFHNDTYTKGPVGNFENAISKAQGDIIFLSDQDDIWLPNKVARHLEAHAKFDLVVSNAIVTDENQNVLFQSFFKVRGSRKGMIKNLFRNSYIGCCMSFKKEIATASMPFPADIHMHDWWIGLVAELKGSICFVEEPLMYYIRHSENASDTLVKTLPVLKQMKNRLILLKNIAVLAFVKGKVKE